MDKYFRGGLFFNPNQAVGGGTKYSFSTIVNTRALASAVVLPTLATQSAIIQATGNQVTITALNSPLPRTQTLLAINNTVTGFFGAFIFSLALGFKFASIISFIVKERADKAKHQQIVSGMNMASYWFGNFVYDYILYLVIAVISLGLIQAFTISALT